MVVPMHIVDILAGKVTAVGSAHVEPCNGQQRHEGAKVTQHLNEQCAVGLLLPFQDCLNGMALLRALRAKATKGPSRT